MTEPKLCRDCKHFSDDATYPSCYHPSITRIETCYGHVMGVGVHVMRYSHLCKPEGILFEPKPTLLQKIKNLFVKEKT